MTKTFDGMAGDLSTKDLAEFSIAEINNFRTLESEVKEINISTYEKTAIINGEKAKRFSLTEEILCYTNGEYRIKAVGQLVPGDTLCVVNYNPEENGLNEYQVTSVEIIEEKTDVYQFNRSPFGLIVADGLVVENGHPSPDTN